MRTRTLLLRFAIPALLLALGSSVPSSAQTTEADVSARLIGKPLLLRGFWLNDNLKFDAAGRPLGTYKTGSFTESSFKAQKVKIEGDHLTIEGQREAIVFSQDGTVKLLPMGKSKIFSTTPEKVTIVIDGHANLDFGKELDAIFASTLGEIAPSLPVFWQPYAEKYFQPRSEAASEALATIGTPAGVSKIAPAHGGVKAPKLIHSTEPKFPDMARQQKFSGNVMVYL